VLAILKSLVLIVLALFPIVNPVGGSPVFLNSTLDYSRQTRKKLAWHVALNSFFLLIASYTVGTLVLSFFGISLPVVQVGGGLIVVAAGWSMLKHRSEDESRHRSAEGTVDTSPDVFDSAFYPLTLPLTVGPGSISVAITLGANEPKHLDHLGTSLLELLVAAIACAIIATTVYLCYGYADRLAAAIGPSAMNVILRLSSFLLVCIGVQIMWNGISALVKSLLPALQ
jgi:multiple antibiotic resistance protein